MQEAREIAREDGGTDSIVIIFRWESPYGSGRTSRWLRMCARWMCCNYVGCWRTNYNVFLVIFEPIGLTMRVKCFMFASLLRPRVNQTFRRALATVKCRRTEEGTRKQQTMVPHQHQPHPSTEPLLQLLHCGFTLPSGRHRSCDRVRTVLPPC